MKYKLIWIVFLIIMLSFRLNGQNCSYRISYDFICIKDTVKQEYWERDHYLLLANDDFSRFLRKERYYNDSLMDAFSQKHPDPTEFGNFTQEDLDRYVERIIKNAPKNIKIVRSDIFVQRNRAKKTAQILAFNSFPDSYLIEMLDLKWEIKSERKMVHGIETIKATVVYGGRNYTAWFAPSIPINDGPYVFKGLPGLILEVSDSEGWYHYIVNELNLASNPCDWSDKYDGKYVELDRNSFIKWMEKQMTNPSVLPGLSRRDRAELILKLNQEYKNRYELLLERPSN